MKDKGNWLVFCGFCNNSPFQTPFLQVLGKMALFRAKMAKNAQNHPVKINFYQTNP